MALQAQSFGAEIAFESDFNYNLEQITSSFSVIFAVDGLHSGVRKTVLPSQKVNRFSHSYIELVLNSNVDLHKHGLHIWPETESMLIALPNQDQSFTCTLFLPNAWAQQPSDKVHLTTILDLLQIKYPLFYEKYKSYLHTEHLKVSALESVLCEKWIFSISNATILLLSDAAHGVLPFYGQGMNAGFEDVSILTDIINKEGIKISELEKFSIERMKDVKALHQMVLENFYDMKGERNFNKEFLKRYKAMELQKVNDPYHNKTRYEWVSFSNIPYREILEIENKLMTEN